MIVNKELLFDMLYISALASIISSQLIQKIKETFKFGSKFNKILSIIISYIIGMCYALSFYTSNLLYAIWIGFFTLIGAEGLYKAFNGYFGLKSANSNNK